MRIPAYLTIMAIPLALAGCEGGEQEAQVAEMPMAGEEMPMAGGMPMGTGAETAQAAGAEGTVTAIDQGAGTVTIKHGPVPAVNWPAMTMAFTANDPLRQQVQVGDEVNFEFRKTASGGEIISITPK